MAALSYREKTLYASLVVEIVVYLPYFFLHGGNSLNKVVGMIGAILALQILLQGLIALITRNRMTDERDKLIELRGYRAGYLTFATLMLLGLGMLWAHAAAGRLHIDGRMMGLHFLSVFFGMLVIADITKTATQIVSYRKAL
ncbi:MAG TPA: hypothetical protein VMT38_00690 [Terracidiphilus sp.]|nr:hypothetical protein [Terracidiphilus sp.]